MLEDIDLSAIQEENARQLIRRLLNLIEELSADVRDLRAENQALRDEINHLKGNRASRMSRRTNHGQEHAQTILRRKNVRRHGRGTNRARKPKSKLIAKKW